MSDSEQGGRCRKQLEAWYANNASSVPRYSWMIADAIDRLAADVAAVMEMTREIALRVPSEFGQDACDVAVRVALKERDAAVRGRDKARAENEQLKADGNRLLQDARGLSERCKELALMVARQGMERRAAGNSPKIPDSPPAAPPPAGHGISPGLPETQSAGNAAPAAGWLTERERRAVAYFAEVCRDDLVPDEWTDSAGVLRSLLARAGSPPVVEVPLFAYYAPEVLHLRYRDAISRAGIQWKEVGSE